MRGILKLSGQVGEFSFYKKKGDFFARNPEGIDGNRIKTEPNFERVRENNEEFKKALQAGELMRTALRTMLRITADTSVSTRLTRLMMKVIKADAVSERGKRNVIDGETDLLRGFEFNENTPLKASFIGNYTTVINRATGALTVNIPAFIPDEYIDHPLGASHCQLIMAGVEVDFEAGTYVVNTARSANIDFGVAEHAEIDLSAAVTPASTKPLFVAFGIEFFQNTTGGVAYPLRNHGYNALKLVEVDGGV